jgi:hypothetical protein
MVSDSTLSTDVFTAIRNVLVASAPYITNSTTSATSAATINAVYNDKEPQRPQITINPVTFDESEWKFGSIHGHKMINVNIDCYASNTLGVDQLFDQVSASLKGTVIDGMEMVAIASDYGFSSASDAKYHVKSMTLTYDRE